MRSPKNFVGGEPGAPGSPSARRRLPLGRSPRLVGSARFDLCGGARLNLGARQLGDEAVGRAHRAMIDFGEPHIVELAAADDDRGVALDALPRDDALAVGAGTLGARADLFARREGEVGGIDAFLHSAIVVRADERGVGNASVSKWSSRGGTY